MTLELPPGELVTERRLIEKVGLGRTPVREAVQRLAWEGLMEVRPRAGLVVAPLRPQDWIQVLDARRGVEVVLAASAARRITASTAEMFRDAAMAMQDAVLNGNVVDFLEADKALDEAAAAAAENPFAVRVAAPLQAHSRRFWFRYRRASGLAEAAEHHVGIIRAILDGNPNAAGEEAARLIALLRLYAEEAARP